jgi:hypothetical protein
MSGHRWRVNSTLPALIAARFASRIATICFASRRVSSRLLLNPPRRPISARYSRAFFSMGDFTFDFRISVA